jgi:hypothetical protein
MGHPATAQSGGSRRWRRGPRRGLESRALRSERRERFVFVAENLPVHGAEEVAGFGGVGFDGSGMLCVEADELEEILERVEYFDRLLLFAVPRERDVWRT